MSVDLLKLNLTKVNLSILGSLDGFSIQQFSNIQFLLEYFCITRNLKFLRRFWRVLLVFHTQNNYSWQDFVCTKNKSVIWLLVWAKCLLCAWALKAELYGHYKWHCFSLCSVLLLIATKGLTRTISDTQERNCSGVLEF